MKNWKEALVASVDLGGEAAATRRSVLTNNGVTPEDAAIIDAAFMDVVIKMSATLGEGFDELAVYLYPVALSYIMRGVNVNMKLMEDMINEEMKILADLAGIPTIVVDDGTPPTPGCDCPVCNLKNMRREHATRH